MAITQAGARLTEAHRLAQVRLGARTVDHLLQAWPLLDPIDLDGTTPRWVSVSRSLVAAQHRESVLLAADYMRAFRAVELGTLDGFRLVTPSVDLNAVTTSLVVTGPVHAKAAIAGGARLAEAMEIAAATAAGSGMRHALAGGRNTITGTVGSDPDAVGWRRVTSGNACEFCSMLAGRGAVYRERAHFAAHDSCSCTAEPLYSA